MRKQLAAVAMMTVMGWAAASQAQAPAADKPAAAAPAGTKPPAMEVPKPPPENDVIKKSAGSWRCTGAAKGPEGQEMKYTSTWSVKPTMGGHWYAITYKRSKAGPMPAFEGQATVGYSTADKKYSMIGFDSWGGWINLSSADGAVYTGQSADMGKASPAKFTFSPGKDKKGEDSDKLFDVTMEFGMGGATENCKK
jgi:hypothetical protein